MIGNHSRSPRGSQIFAVNVSRKEGGQNIYKGSVYAPSLLQDPPRHRHPSRSMLPTWQLSPASLSLIDLTVCAVHVQATWQSSSRSTCKSVDDSYIVCSLIYIVSSTSYTYRRPTVAVFLPLVSVFDIPFASSNLTMCAVADLTLTDASPLRSATPARCLTVRANPLK